MCQAQYFPITSLISEEKCIIVCKKSLVRIGDVVVE